MPFSHAPIVHDRQSMESAVPQSTVSNIFVDVTGATITSKDLGESGTYQIATPILISSSLNNTLASFRVVLDGNQIGDVSVITLKIKELDIGFTFTGTLPGINTNQVIQLQYSTDKGTLTLSEFSMTIDGIPTSRVVQ
jgi:hypothetical protein